jgi:hypothetical protein
VAIVVDHPASSGACPFLEADLVACGSKAYAVLDDVDGP